MDNVRNITGSPVAGLDADELIDTRELCQQVQDLITNKGQGNPAFTNLPRKFNIAIAGCRDNSVHAEINDIAFVPAFKDDRLGFNVLVGGDSSLLNVVQPRFPWMSGSSHHKSSPSVKQFSSRIGITASAPIVRKHD
ncbi:hypothetical protein [Leptodesmis sp.]|uniref:hypothetical protein n=1 Tax=Leptodesmis sp. TaxID=3100501 RepID=UPI0040534EE3